MQKKYKIKKRKKIISPYHIFFIFAIFAIFLSYGYALFSDSLTIKGTANILSNKEYGKSVYWVEQRNIWGRKWLSFCL